MLKRPLPKRCLKGSINELFQTDIIHNILEKYNCQGKCLLILDEKSSHLISNYFSMTDIISQGIFSVELITKIRKPFESYDAIYIISNTSESIDLMIKDFDFSLEDNQHISLYKHCHLFIIDPIEQNKNIYNSLLNEFFLRRIKTFKEIFLDFTALDKNLYYFGTEYNFNPIYHIFCVNDNTAQNNICIKKLYSICLVSDTYPNIIYFVHDPSCKYIAERLNKKLETYFTNHKKIVKNGILLLTSRLMDLPAPIQFDLNYGHLLFEKYKSNTNPEKKVINIDLKGNGQRNDIILDHTDILYNKYKNYTFYDVLTGLPNDLKKFNESDIAKVNKVNNMDSLNEMNDAIKNFGEYQYKTKLFSQHLDLAKCINESNKKRNIVNLIDLQSTIMSGATSKGKRLKTSELNEILLQNISYFDQSDTMRLLELIRYYNPDNDVSELCDKINNLSINENDLKLIEYFTQERSLIEEDAMKRINKEIILFRNKYKYNTNEEKENKNDKRYLCVKESKLTTICDMCCKNSLPKEDFEYVEKPKFFNDKGYKKLYKANSLIENQDLDLESKIPLNLDNLIIFNVGGISTYEISSLEKANKNKQFNMNLIYGSNQIYNHEEYIKYIQEYFKGNSGIMRGGYLSKMKSEAFDEDNDSREVLNNEKHAIQYLNESKEQKVNVNLYNKQSNIMNSEYTNKQSNIMNSEYMKNSSINKKETMNYDIGPVSNSVFKPQSQNIKNTENSDDDSDSLSDYK